jgi:hypothetical protein
MKKLFILILFISVLSVSADYFTRWVVKSKDGKSYIVQQKDWYNTKSTKWINIYTNYIGNETILLIDKKFNTNNIRIVELK